MSDSRETQIPGAFDRATLLKAAGGAAALLALPGASALASSQAATAAWPMPTHDITGSRHAPRVTRNLATRWAADMPGGVPGAAAIVSGYAVAASLAGDVASFRLSDGAQRWRRSFGTATYGSGADVRQLGFFGGVAVSGNRVVFASDRARAVDLTTGKSLWTQPPLRTDTSDDYFWGPPTIVGSTVIFGSGSGAELPTARGRITAYDLHSGRKLWSTPMTPAGGEGGGVLAPTTIDAARGLVYAGTGSSYGTPVGSAPGTCSLVALRLSDGKVVWSDQVFPGDTHGFDFNSAPVLIGSRLLIMTNKNGIYAWDRQARKRLWNRQLTPSTDSTGAAGPTTGPEGGPIAADGKRVYVLSNDNDSGTAVAAALDPWTGKPIWRHRIPTFSFTAVAVGGGRMFTSGADGTLRTLDTATGKHVAGAPLGNPSTAPAALAPNAVVVGTGAAPFLPGEQLICLGG